MESMTYEEYQDQCYQVDQVIAGYDDETIYEIIEMHAFVTRFFGHKSILEMGLHYKATEASLIGFTEDVRKNIIRTLSLKWHPDKGGNLGQCQYLLGRFNNFINNHEKMKKYCMYLCTMDSFHSLIDYDTNEWLTHENIPLPDGFEEKYSPQKINTIPTFGFLDRDCPHPIFCHPLLTYKHEQRIFSVGRTDFISYEHNVDVLYKAKIGKLVYYALRFHELPNNLFWIKRKDSLKAKYLARKARASFFRFFKVKRINIIPELSMILRKKKEHGKKVRD